MRRWSHDEREDEKLFARGERTGGANGVGTCRGVSIPVLGRECRLAPKGAALRRPFGMCGELMEKGGPQAAFIFPKPLIPL